MGKEDVDISLSGGSLWICGERAGDPQEREDVSVYVRERRYGSFRRSINMPATVDREQISASLVDGVLEITVDGWADPADHEHIEIAEGGRTQVDLDVRPGAGSRG